MKRKLKLLMIATLVGGTLSINAQEREESKIKVEISKEVNGEKQTFKGEYNSTEEMKADPNYQEFAGKDEEFDFWVDGDLDEADMSIHLDQLKNMTKSFKLFDGDDDDFNILFKHFGEDGEDGNHFFKHFGNDSSSSFHFDDLNMEEFNEKMKDLGIELDLLMDRFGGSGDNQIKIITLKRVQISDVGKEEFGEKGTVSESNRLLLEDLSFSPNPSTNGRFMVRFKVPEEKDLSIRVYNLEGKEVFNRSFERFGGLYSEMIDLSGQKEGIYLLEITQGRKRLTKKIAIN